MDCDIVVNEFEHQSRNYDHFRTHTLGKGMNPFYPPSHVLGSIVPLLLVYKDGFDIK